MKRKIVHNKKGWSGLVVGVTCGDQLGDFDWFQEVINGIDLDYEEAVRNLQKEGKSEEEIEEELQDFESSHWLFGDWMKDEQGRYVPDPTGKYGFSATYSNTNGAIICVEASQYAMECNKTSPCYVMKDGRPCGDLDTEGRILAYCLPPDWFSGE